MFEGFRSLKKNSKMKVKLERLIKERGKKGKCHQKRHKKILILMKKYTCKNDILYAQEVLSNFHSILTHYVKPD